MYSDPWARLTMSMMPNTSVNPAASKNSMSPNCNPLSDCSTSSTAFMPSTRGAYRAGILQSPT